MHYKIIPVYLGPYVWLATDKLYLYSYTLLMWLGLWSNFKKWEDQVIIATQPVLDSFLDQETPYLSKIYSNGTKVTDSQSINQSIDRSINHWKVNQKVL